MASAQVDVPYISQDSPAVAPGDDRDVAVEVVKGRLQERDDVFTATVFQNVDKPCSRATWTGRCIPPGAVRDLEQA